MSIIISKSILQSKLKAKTAKKNNIAVDEDFDAEVEKGKTLDAQSGDNAKTKVKSKDAKDNKLVVNTKNDKTVETNEKVEKEELKHGVLTLAQTQTTIAKSIVSSNQTKQELGKEQSAKDFKELAQKEKSLVKFLEEAGKEVGLKSAQIEVESTEIKTSDKRKNTKTAKDNIKEEKESATEQKQKLTDIKENKKQDAPQKQQAAKENIDDKQTQKQEVKKGESEVLKKQKPKLETENVAPRQDAAKDVKTQKQDEKQTVTLKQDSLITEKAPTLSDLLKLTEHKTDKDAKQTKKTKKEEAESGKSIDNDKTSPYDYKTDKQKAAADEKVKFVETKKEKESAKDNAQDKPKMQMPLSFEQLQTTQTQEINAKIAQTTQTVRYFSEDLKEQIDSYKPPLMKLSLNLNPQNLGAVEITMVARGGALNVSMTSNQSALSMLMQNSGQLHQNLTALGFNNLAINFNSGDKKSSDKKFDSENKKDEAQKRYTETKESEGFLESIELKIFDSKYV